MPGYEWILAERPGTCYGPCLITAGRRQCLRRFALFYPGNQLIQLAVRRRSRAAAAMGDARRQEQPRKLRSLFRTPHLLRDAFEVIDGSLRCEKIGRERILEDAGIPPFQTSSKNTSSISAPRAVAKALAEPHIAKPHFSRTRMEATLSSATLA